jgi:prepilin-type N-terminal cleavage/methylation domain-containing protein/prepilin-type processing-associated H-X9-DG protein
MPEAPQNRGGLRRTAAQGFTLVELLVVIAIIAILAALLLPTLARAKNKAWTVQCLNNLNQLAICWHEYAMDNGDYLVPNNSIEGVTTNGAAGSEASGGSWCLATPDEINVEAGMLFQYNTSLGIYHCPADHSTLTSPAGNDNGTLRSRSYNMSESVNGYPGFDYLTSALIPSFTLMGDIKSPNVANCMVFIDENEYTLLDSQFGMPTEFYDGSTSWWDMPANRHEQGANLSFADGHAERYSWAVPEIFVDWIQPVSAAGMPDWVRIKMGIKQTMN